jgi:hypothetical protein
MATVETENLTTRVIADEITHPKPATIIKKSKGDGVIHSGYGYTNGSLTGPKHALIDMVMWSDSVDSQNQERDGKQEAEQYTNPLTLVRAL